MPKSALLFQCPKCKNINPCRSVLYSKGNARTRGLFSSVTKVVNDDYVTKYHRIRVCSECKSEFCTAEIDSDSFEIMLVSNEMSRQERSLAKKKIADLQKQVVKLVSKQNDLLLHVAAGSQRIHQLQKLLETTNSSKVMPKQECADRVEALRHFLILREVDVVFNRLGKTH